MASVRPTKKSQVFVFKWLHWTTLGFEALVAISNATITLFDLKPNEFGLIPSKQVEVNYLNS